MGGDVGAPRVTRGQLRTGQRGMVDGLRPQVALILAEQRGHPEPGPAKRRHLPGDPPLDALADHARRVSQRLDAVPRAEHRAPEPFIHHVAMMPPPDKSRNFTRPQMSVNVP